MDSILLSVKKQLGVPDDYDGFDQEIISAINSGIFSLNQLGIGSETGVWITGDDETWDIITGIAIDLEVVKHYIYLKARQSYDPPSTAHAIASLERQIDQLEWRLMAQVETYVAPTE